MGVAGVSLATLHQKDGGAPNGVWNLIFAFCIGRMPKSKMPCQSMHRSCGLGHALVL
jgi:L,D-peptidoglycan transpeptidase YkuD (ErfK/YbiS/YcfS/YnhG family)